MNLTDVDDKTIKNSIETFGGKADVKDLRKYTDKYSKLFFADLDKLNVSRQNIKFIRVSDVIPAIQNFILKLIAEGYAYRASDGSTYFNIEKYQQDFGHYGELVGEKFLEGTKIGGSAVSPQALNKADEYTKDDVNDFALWKARTPEDANIFWSHPDLGDGRPGWHIECSAINHVAFGDKPTDIHTGGVDLIFPHHTNEIAQSEAYSGHIFVKNWLHSEHILVDGKKMAKSLGNFFTLQDLEKEGFNPLSYRYLLLQTSYKQKVNFTWDSLKSADKGYQNLKNKIAKLKESIGWFNLLLAQFSRGGLPRGESSSEPEVSPQESYLNDFSTKIATLNTAAALASLQGVLSAKDLTPAQKLALIKKFDEVLGLKLI